MSLTYSEFRINGSVVGVGPRLRLTRLTVNYDSHHELEFSEGPTGPKPGYTLNTPVELIFDKNGERVVGFRGRIASSHPSRGTGYYWGYRAIGISQQLDFLPVIHPNGQPRYQFNLKEDDPDFSASHAGKTLGEICQILLEDHEDELDELGVGITHLTDFDSLTHTPLDPVTFEGEGFWNSFKALVNRFAPGHEPYLEYETSATEIRLADLADPDNVHDLVIGQEKIDPPMINWDISNCASRIRIRGGEKIEGFEFSREKGELLRDWTNTEETQWTLSDFEDTTKAVCVGTVQSMTEDTVEVDPTSNTLTWGSNHWAGARRGRIRVKATPIAGVTTQETRPIASCDALTAGGTATIFVTHPFTANTFTDFECYGLRLLREHVWRRYKLADEDQRLKIRRSFPEDTVYRVNGGSAALTGIRTPMASIYVDGVPYPGFVEVDQNDGSIYFTEPVVSATALGNTKEDLLAGTVTNEPDDERVFLPISVGINEAWYPTDQSHDGKAHNWFGLERTKTVFLPEWRDSGKTDQITELAEVLHKSMSDPVASGSLVIHGFRAHQFCRLNQGVNLTAKVAPGGATLDIGRASQLTFGIRSMTVDWGEADGMRVTLGLSTDRRPGSSPDLYNHGVGRRAITNNLFPFGDLPTTFFADRGFQ